MTMEVARLAAAAESVSVPLADIPNHACKRVFHLGLCIAMFRVDDKVYALEDSCPHAGASIANGKVEAGTVRCPAHGMRFDLTTGGMPGNSAFRVRTYPVTVGADTVTVQIAAPESGR
jgi:3-phenylpropionate/trans-cinnamate dioxygenase ferredoxin subunit